MLNKASLGFNRFIYNIRYYEIFFVKSCSSQVCGTPQLNGFLILFGVFPTFGMTIFFVDFHCSCFGISLPSLMLWCDRKFLREPCISWYCVSRSGYISIGLSCLPSWFFESVFCVEATEWMMIGMKICFGFCFMMCAVFMIQRCNTTFSTSETVKLFLIFFRRLEISSCIMCKMMTGHSFNLPIFVA